MEFDIIGEGDSTCNKSPVVYIDHHLGLEKWCVPHLYEYAYKKVMQFKLNIQRSGNDENSTFGSAKALIFICRFVFDTSMDENIVVYKSRHDKCLESKVWNLLEVAYNFV